MRCAKPEDNREIGWYGSGGRVARIEVEVEARKWKTNLLLVPSMAMPVHCVGTVAALERRRGVVDMRVCLPAPVVCGCLGLVLQSKSASRSRRKEGRDGEGKDE